MSLPHHSTLAPKHIQFFCGGTDVINLAVLWVAFHELLPFLPCHRPKDRTGRDRDVVSSERVVGLLTGDQQKVAIRKTAATVKIKFLFFETNGAGILWMRIRVKIGEIHDIDSQSTENINPGGAKIKRSGVGELFIEMHVEVAHHDFIPGYRFVAV